MGFPRVNFSFSVRGSIAHHEKLSIMCQRRIKEKTTLIYSLIRVVFVLKPFFYSASFLYQCPSIYSL